ncbi:MAG: SpoVR family protein [bacterium]|nr:SpoVR family protein [bacterium]
MSNVSDNELRRLSTMEDRIREIATEEGLAIREVSFEIVRPSRMFEGMSYLFPGNFSHWSHGRDFDRARTIYEHTMSGVAQEQVWNFDDPRAFILDTNPFALKVLTMAHVFGHVDFFMMNKFLQQGRALGDIAIEARSAAERFAGYEQKYGQAAVEDLIEAALSIRWHQDPDIFFEEPDEEMVRSQLLALEKARFEKDSRDNRAWQRLSGEERGELMDERLAEISRRTPPRPTYDLLWYMINRSPKTLKPWMKDVLTVVRKQARVLAPNIRTKTLNEGWASYWHLRIMRRLFSEGLITNEEHGAFMSFHAGLTARHAKSLNPYNLGLAIFEDVEERWNKGRFGRDYDDCKNHEDRINWDTGVGLGSDKIFKVREGYTDRMAVEDLFSDDFIYQAGLYIFVEMQIDDTIFSEVIDASTAQNIRRLLKNIFANSAMPIVITVENGNLGGRQMLGLKHHFDGAELDMKHAERTLANIFRIWDKKIYLETVVNGEPTLLSHDGKHFKVITGRQLH